MAATQNPLTIEDCATCNQVLENVAAATDLARKCKDCGLPVDEMLITLQAQKEQAEKIKANFFPGER